MLKRSRPQIPPIKLPPDMRGLQIAFDAIREQVQVDQGDRGHPLDRAVKVRDLMEAGLAEFKLHKSGNSDFAEVVAPGRLPNLNKPPKPTNLVATGTTATVYLLWDEPNYSYHAYAEIWRSSENNLSTATLLGARPSYRSYADPVDAGSTYYYWIRFVSKAGKHSDYNAIEGVEAATVLPVSHVLETLSGQITASELVQGLREEIEKIPSIESGLSDEIADRIAALQGEANERNAAIQAEGSIRAQQIQQEVADRELAISAEQQARAQAIIDEATARADAIQQEAITRAQQVQAESEARTEQLTNESAARIAAIENEAANRSAAVLNEARQRIEAFQNLTLSAIDVAALKNLDRVVSGEQARITQLRSLTAQHQTLKSTTTAEVARLDEAVATESEVRASAITSLTAQFQSDLGVVQEAAVEEAINVISTDDDVIAQVITKISAADTNNWATTTYVTDNAVTPLNAVSSRVDTLESQYQAIDSTYVSLSSFSDWQQSYTSDKEALTESISSLESAITNPSTGLTSKASSSELTQAKSDIYNSSVSQFGQIASQFQSQQTDIDSRATSTELTNTVSSVMGAEVSEFSNISARFDLVDESLSAKAAIDNVDTAISNAEKASVKRVSSAMAAITAGEISSQVEALKAVEATTTAERSLIQRLDAIKSEYKTGLSVTTAQISQAQQILTSDIEALAETVTQHQTSYLNDKTNTLASKVEVEQAKSDVFGAEVTDFYNLDAQFQAQQTDIDTRATKTELASAIATGQEARTTLSQQIEAQLQSQQTDINTRATKTELSEAISTEQQARAAEVSGLQASVNNVEQGLTTKASTDDLNSAVASLDEAITLRAEKTITALTQADFSSTAESLKSTAQSVDSDRSVISHLNQIQSEYKTGISATKAEIIQTSNIITSELLALSETVTLHKASYDDDKANTLATKAEIDQAKSDVLGAEVTDFEKLDARFQSQQTDIDTRATSTQLSDAVANEQQARSSLAQQIDAQFQSQQEDINNRATQTFVTQAMATEEGARVSAVQQLSTDIGAANQAILQQTSEIDGLKTNWAVKFQTGSDGIQRISGFGISSDGNTTSAHFDVEQFSISRPGAEALDFAVINGKVMIDAAKIANLQVDSGMITGLVADKITAGQINVPVSLSAATIYGGGVRLGQGGILKNDANGQSKGYGMAVDNDGSVFVDKYFKAGNSSHYVEYHNGQLTVRGHIDAQSGAFSGTLKTVAFDSAGSTIKSEVNNSYGPLISTLRFVWGNARYGTNTNRYDTPIYLGSMKLIASTSTGENKISTRSGKYIMISGAVKAWNSWWYLEYSLDSSGAWHEIPESWLLMHTGTFTGILLPFSFSMDLYGANGVANNSNTEIHFRLRRHYQGHMSYINVTFTYNNM